MEGLINNLTEAVTSSWLRSDSDTQNANEMVEADSESTTIFQSTTSIYELKDKYISKIFEYVNYTDLLELRLVDRRLSKIVANSRQFLSSTVFVVSVKPGNVTNSSFLDSPVAYENARFRYIDCDVLAKRTSFDQYSSGNYYFRPGKAFLSHLKAIEFQACFITWETIKRLVNDTPKLEELSLDGCHFTDEHRGTNAILGEFDAFQVGRVFSGLRTIKISETAALKPMNKLLEKLLGYFTKSANALEKLMLTYTPRDPKDGESTREEMLEFCNLVRRIIELNVVTLRTLALDVKSKPLLNIIFPNVFASMDTAWGSIQLEEFSISPPGCTPLPDPIYITENGLSSAQTLVAFLESQQFLQKVAMPHIAKFAGINQESQHYRAKIGHSFPKSIEYICIPNQEYLALDFHSRYPRLGKLYIGGVKADNGEPISFKSKMFDENKVIVVQPTSINYVDCPMALSGSAMPQGEEQNSSLEKVAELGIGSTIICYLELFNTIKKFRFLVKFEIASDFPVVQDDDLQSCIENTPLLQYLRINACNYLTDYGVTGILRNTCEMMVRLNNYHDMADKVVDGGKSNFGKPLSQLKGLRHLILMGESHITDVGIHFGLRFQELQTVCLPYNERITEWGIIQLGHQNPSLHTFIAWALNERSKEGLLKVKECHPRIRQIKCVKTKANLDKGLPDDFSSALVEYREVKRSFTTSLFSMCPEFSFRWLLGMDSRFVDDGEQVSMDLELPPTNAIEDTPEPDNPTKTEGPAVSA